MSSYNQIVEVFRNRGCRATPQRIAIAKAVLGSSEHPSAEVIYEKVRQNHPTLSLSTVYNTLHLLKDMNIVKELAFNDSIRFDSNIKLHVNLICERCGKIIDVEDPDLEELHRRISERNGFRVKGRRLDVYGICKNCLGKGDR